MSAGSANREGELWFRGRPPAGVAGRLARLASFLRIDGAHGSDDADPTDGQPGEARPQAEAAIAAGERMAQARQEAGLTTRELAERLGLSLWKTERLEAGRDEIAGHLPSIAAATAKQVDFFQLAPDRESAPESRTQPLAGRGLSEPVDTHPPANEKQERFVSGANLVLACLVLLVVIRFFTEAVVVLPRSANFVDIPIFLLIVFVALVRARNVGAPTKLTTILLLVFALVAMCAVSTLTNLSRVDLAPALVFVYGFLAPIGLFVAVHSLWPVGAAIRLSRVLVALCVLQLMIALGFNLPVFLRDGNPDVISGTFGENPYQLVFFLLVNIGLLAGIFTFERRRFAARLTPVLLFAILAVIFLAQYRSLLATTALTIVLLTVLLSSIGVRGVMIAALTSIALLGTGVYLAQQLPKLKFQATVEDSGGNPLIYVQERLNRLSVIERVFSDTPRFALTGTGPGTYSSRAWRTFALDGDVAGDNMLALTQGRPYRTDVSDKYVQPQLRNVEVFSGSYAISRPFATYLSLLAEVGVLGFLLIVAAYVWALVRSLRMALASGRAALPGDPLPALCCASTVAFFVLLQMGTLDNWLEVTRITFIAWIVLAVAVKEFEGRRPLDA
ncbi:MAG: helix-turn-helix domain-containing protein [Solirubrobacteraceae bacterium]